MASFQYDPGVSYHGDQYAAQAGQALANDVTNMFAQHHANKLQDQLDQANAAKAKVTMDFLARQQNPTNPQEMGASLEDMAAFHDALAKGNPTKATKIAEGAAANFATSVALQHQASQQPGYRYLQPQGAPPGTPPMPVVTGSNVQPIITKPVAPVWAPNQAQIEGAKSNGQAYYQTGNNKWELRQIGANDNRIDPSTLTTQTIPGTATADNPTGLQIMVDKNGRLLKNDVIHTPTQPLQITQVPVPGSTTPLNVLRGGGVKTQVITDPSGKPKLQLTPEELATGASLGYKALRQSNGSFVWEKDPAAQLAANNDAVKNFDAHIGKTYGVKSADIFNLNLTEPGAIKYEDAKGNALSTEQAAKAGYGATAVVPIAGEFSTKSKRIPLPEWNTIVNQWQQLPRAGATGGVTVQGGSGNSATTAPNYQNAAAAVRADFTSGKITRDEAKQKLLELGYQ